MKETVQGFKQFILKGNAVDLAVGIVIGASFSAVVNALVKDLITPLIGALGGQPDFSINALVIYFFVVTPMNKLLANVNKNKNTVDPTTTKCTECLSEIPLAARRCAFCTSIQTAKKN
jgi:large conductance mechanosensitive channel